MRGGGMRELWMRGGGMGGARTRAADGRGGVGGPGPIAAYRSLMALPPLVEPTGPLSPTETARLEQVRNLPQLRLPPIDDLGHRRLAAARVLVLGSTGLSAPAVRSLAAAGVGT